MATLAYPSGRGALLGATPWQEWVAEVGMPALEEAQWATRTLVRAVLVALAWPLRLAWLVLSRARWGTGETVFCTVLAAGPVGLLVRLYPSVRWPTAEQALTDLQQVGAVLLVAWLVLYLIAASNSGTTRIPAAVRAAGGACACGYTSAGPADLHRHERAHVDACRGEGGGSARYEVWQNADGSWSGRTYFADPARVWALPPASIYAIYAAGVKAAPSTTSPNDGPLQKLALRGVPGSERGAVRREGEKRARSYR